jgi:hypothetical protein
MNWWLLFVAIALLLWGSREYFVDTEFSPVTRPSRSTDWLSKIDAEAPIGGDDDEYIAVLQAFYDKVYVPSPNRPKDTDVEVFLKTPDANRPGIDINAMRKIIAAGFRVERTTTAAQREEKEIKFKPTEALEPKDGRDQVYNRTEQIYVPADTRIGELPEGVYEPTEQQERPRRPGYWSGTSWTGTKFYGVCAGGPCEQNVL